MCNSCVNATHEPIPNLESAFELGVAGGPTACAGGLGKVSRQVTVSEPPAETVDLSERLAAISKRLSALQKLLIK